MNLRYAANFFYVSLCVCVHTREFVIEISTGSPSELQDSVWKVAGVIFHNSFHHYSKQIMPASAVWSCVVLT